MEAYQSSNLWSDALEKTTFLSNYTRKSEQVRDVLDRVDQDSLESLVLVDTIQRLGLEYRFEKEIEAILHHHYCFTKSDIPTYSGHDLYRTSLCFRLLRQQGFQVLADNFFGTFKDHEDGGFKLDDELSISETVRSLLALHEASHLSMEGENILHEAAIFSSHYLNNKLIIACLDGDQSKMVKHYLLYPQHKSLSGFAERDFLGSFSGEKNEWEEHHRLLRELAKLESAVVESLHKDEILQVAVWWKSLGLSKELKSINEDHPLKWHLWSMAILRGPTWSQHRTLLSKPISLVYIVDDIFDRYGTIGELYVFTEAVNRWEISAAEKLPSYMKICLVAIYDATEEISRVVSQEHGWNPIEFLKKEWGKLLDAFLMEAQWFRSGELPRADGYLKNGVVSSGVAMVLAHLFFLMGNCLTKETEILLNDEDGITYSVAKLLRLLDDFGASDQDEQDEGYDGSYVLCYMEEPKLTSFEAAHEHVMAMVSQTWQNLNNHCLSSTTPFHQSFRKACLNAARMVPPMYIKDENHHLRVLENHAGSILRDTNFAKLLLIQDRCMLD